MAIYSRFGAPVEFVSAYRPHPGFWLVKAKQTGPYPDGSGKTCVGEYLYAFDRVAQGWSCIAYFRADGGIREINDTAEKIPEETPSNAGRLMNYYWPSVFTRQGEMKKIARR